MEIALTGKCDDRVVAVFGALADPVRLQIVRQLRDGQATVGALAKEIGVGAPSVSKHLTVLERAGLIARRTDAQRRQCTLIPEGFTEVASWLDHYEGVWSDRIDRLASLLHEKDASA